MSSIQLGDYIIFEDGAKKKLGEVVEKIPGKEPSYTVVLEKNRYTEKESNESVDAEAVLLNLGPEPKYGSVYGNQIEPRLKTIAIRNWGELHLYTKLEHKDALKSALKTVWDKIEAIEVTELFPLELEVRHIRGQKGGEYAYRPDGVDVIRLFNLPSLMIDEDEIVYLLCHEVGHGIWYRLLEEDQRARWVNLYAKIFKHEVVGHKEMVKMLRDFSDSGQTIKDFKSELDEDEEPLFDTAINTIKSNFNLSAREINTLVRTNRLNIDDLMPSCSVEFGEPKELLTEYARKDVYEMFCECVAIHMTGKKLPPPVMKVMEKTVPLIAAYKA